MSQREELRRTLSLFTSLLSVLAFTCLILFSLIIYILKFGEPHWKSSLNDVKDLHSGVDLEGTLDPETGLIVAKNLELVKANCTKCHSGKLIAQNRASKEGWASMIDWMQETQGLWDLGENEGPILEYLESCYGPEQVGRRKNLEIEEWYELE